MRQLGHRLGTLAVLSLLAAVLVPVWSAERPVRRLDLSARTVPLRASQSPASDGCDDPDHGKNLKCKYQKLTDQICRTRDLANTPDIGKVFSARQKERFAEQCDKSQAWVNDESREKDFSDMARKKGATCYVEEILGDRIGDDDGVCTQPERNKDGCVEIDDDGVGDDDGVCEQIRSGKGKKSWEACLETCVVEGGEPTDDPELEDVSRAELLENAVGQAGETISELNDRLEEGAIAYRAAWNVTLPTDPYDPDQCLGMLLYSVNAKFASPMAGSWDRDRESRPYGYDTVNDWRLAANYVIAGDICDDVFAYSWSVGIGGESGGSTQAWCIVAHAADAIVRDVASGLAMLDGEVTSQRIDNAVRCLRYVGEKVRDIKGGVDAANLKLDSVLYNQRQLLAWKTVDLEVVEVKEKREFLVTATESGEPVSGVAFTSIKAGPLGGPLVEIRGRTTVETLDVGVYRVLVDLPQELQSARLFSFGVRHEEGPEPHEGFALFRK